MRWFSRLPPQFQRSLSTYRYCSSKVRACPLGISSPSSTPIQFLILTSNAILRIFSLRLQSLVVLYLWIMNQIRKIRNYFSRIDGLTSTTALRPASDSRPRQPRTSTPAGSCSTNKTPETWETKYIYTFHGFRQAYFGYGSLVLGPNQSKILAQLLVKAN